ncbi:MAG: hypothetical protein ACLFVO_17350 [Chloroflexaceae bacterium]
MFACKLHARVMAYRDWLVHLAPLAADDISQLCRKRYAEMDTQMLALYQLAQQVGVTAFLAALAQAHDQQTFGAEYVEAIVTRSPATRVAPNTDLAPHLPDALRIPQPDVERELAHDKQYVDNPAMPGVKDVCSGDRAHGSPCASGRPGDCLITTVSIMRRIRFPCVCLDAHQDHAGTRGSESS